MNRHTSRPARRAGLERFFAPFERGAQTPWGTAVLLGAWIFGRNLLESVFEAGRAMGFDWRPEVSAPMVFLHFPLFYVTLFLLLALWVRWITRGEPARIARAVAAGFAVLLVAPLVDAVVSGGRGYDLRYLQAAGSILWRFWDPGGEVGEISPGQRVEILLAVLLLGLYAVHLLRGRGAALTAPGGEAALVSAGRECGLSAFSTAWRAAAAMGGGFLLMALLGAWPALFARLGLPGLPAAEAYVAAYQLRGLVANESARHALVLALPFLGVGLLFARELDPARFSALARRVAGMRMLHYTGLAPLGVLLAWLVYRDALPGAFANPVDWTACAVLWVSVAAAYVAAVCWNDLADTVADGVNRRARPLVARVCDVDSLERIGAAAAAVALFLALCAGYAPFLLVAACLVLSWLYSRPPVRLKRIPFVATFTLALLSLTSMAAGFSLFAQEMTPWVFPRAVALPLVLGITFGFVAKDLGDGEGDRAAGTTTIATLLPARSARLAAAFLVAFAFLQAPLFLPLGALAWAAAGACALAGALAALRAPRPASQLLAIFLLFALILAVLLARDPRFLRERGPSWLGAAHAELRAAEEDLRLALVSEGAVVSAETRARLEIPSAEDLRAGLDRLSHPARGYATGREAPWHERVLWSRARDPETGAERPAGDAAGEGRGSPGRARGGDAVAAARELTALRPLHAGGWEALKNAARAQGDLGTAGRACTGAIDLLVRPGDFLRERAALALAGGDFPEAGRVAADLAGAFLLGAREELSWLLAGDLSLRRGHAARAAEAFGRAIDRAPGEADAWSGLGQALHAQGRVAGALEALAKAHALAPRDPWVLNNWGVVLRETGSAAEALARFHAAHDIAPGLFEPVFNLGLTFEQAGRRDEARRWYAEAHRLRPGFGPLEEALRRIGAGEATDAGLDVRVRAG